MSEILHRKEVFEVQVICDRIEHAHHKGKPKHVTAFGYKVTDQLPDADSWGVSSREIVKAWEKPDTTKEDALTFLDREPVEESRDPAELTKAESFLKLASEAPRAHVRMECPRCAYRVTAKLGSLTYVLDKLRDNGVTRISLDALAPLLKQGQYMRDAIERHSDTPGLVPPRV